MRECCRTVDKYLVGQFKTQHHEHQLVKLADLTPRVEIEAGMTSLKRLPNIKRLGIGQVKFFTPGLSYQMRGECI